MIILLYADTVGYVELGRYGEWRSALAHLRNLQWAPRWITVRGGLSDTVTVTVIPERSW